MEPRDELDLRRVGWRLDALDEWRRRTDTRLDGLEAGVRELVNADKIANAVAEALNERNLESRNIHLTRWQTIVAWVGIGFAALGSVAGCVALGVHLASGGHL